MIVGTCCSLKRQGVCVRDGSDRAMIYRDVGRRRCTIHVTGAVDMVFLRAGIAGIVYPAIRYRHLRCRSVE